MYQCRFILGKICTTVVSDIDNEEHCAYVGAKGILEIFLFCLKSLNFV